MKKNLIIVKEYCRLNNLEDSFVDLLMEEGLLEFEQIENDIYLSSDQIKDIERYAHMYYDLSINMEGIDVINHLLLRIEKMRAEIKALKQLVCFYEDRED